MCPSRLTLDYKRQTQSVGQGELREIVDIWEFANDDVTVELPDVNDFTSDSLDIFRNRLP